MGFLTSQTNRRRQTISYQHFILKERHTLMYLMDLGLNYSETDRCMTQDRSTMGFRGAGVFEAFKTGVFRAICLFTREHPRNPLLDQLRHSVGPVQPKPNYS